MFSWAKYDVAGFEDLSPLDQKALLRRTVAELVMLGFARASIAYNSELSPQYSSSGKPVDESHHCVSWAHPRHIVLPVHSQYSVWSVDRSHAGS